MFILENYYIFKYWYDCNKAFVQSVTIYASMPTILHMNFFLDRGTRGMSFVLSSLIFNIIPTMVEIGMVRKCLLFCVGILNIS